MTTNTITIAGNLTREVEIKYTREGKAATTLGVAVDRRWKNRETDAWEEEVSFFDVICWGDLAEHAALSLTKGLRVLVSGKMQQRSWETEDGERKSRFELVADELGPSLRFASAEVHKTTRTTSDESETAEPAT